MMRQSLGQKVYMIWSLVDDSVSFFEILMYVIKIAKIKWFDYILCSNPLILS